MTAPLVSTTDRPYQLLPPLTVEQRDLLRQSIKENGVLEPVVFDEDGEILDGHHRVEIAEELGIDYPRRVIDDLDRPGKHMYALTVNVARRQLDAGTRSGLVAQMRIRGMSLRDIAKAIGVSRGTVANDLAQVSKVGHLPETVTGSDGKEYAASRPKPAPERDLTSDVERALTEAGPSGMTCWQLSFLIDPAGPDAVRAELAVQMAPVLDRLAAEGRACVVGEVDGGLLWALTELVDDEPEPLAEHREVSGWKDDEPGSCGVECACGTTYDGFDSLAEAAEHLARHIELSQPHTETPGSAGADAAPPAGSGTTPAPAADAPVPSREPDPEPQPSRLAVTPEQRKQIAEDGERAQAINNAHKKADRLVAEVSGLITEIEAGVLYGEPGLITAEMVAGLREQADRLEKWMEKA